MSPRFVATTRWFYAVSISFCAFSCETFFAPFSRSIFNTDDVLLNRAKVKQTEIVAVRFYALKIDLKISVSKVPFEKFSSRNVLLYRFYNSCAVKKAHVSLNIYS